MRKNSKPVYKTYRHGALPDMTTQKAYDVFRRLMSGEMELITELLSYFNKGNCRCCPLLMLAATFLLMVCRLAVCRSRVFVVVPEEHAVQRRLLWP